MTYYNCLKEVWFISDTHFNHANILKFEPDKRFSTPEDRNELIIQNWTRLVKPEDKIYHLGDVYFGGLESYLPIHKRLTGKKRLLIGNHDNVAAICQQNLFQKIGLWRVWDKAPLVFTHVPIHPDSIIERTHWETGWNVHGHIHSNKSPGPQYYCVCVEQTNYSPVSIEQLISAWKEHI